MLEVAAGSALCALPGGQIIGGMLIYHGIGNVAMGLYEAAASEIAGEHHTLATDLLGNKQGSIAQLSWDAVGVALGGAGTVASLRSLVTIVPTVTAAAGGAGAATTATVAISATATTALSASSTATLANLIMYSRSATNPPGSQEHHLGTNKGESYKHEFDRIAEKYDLDLDEAWNKTRISTEYHGGGRHPSDYHRWMLREFKKADKYAKGDPKKFVDFLRRGPFKKVIENPEMVRKPYWSDRP